MNEKQKIKIREFLTAQRSGQFAFLGALVRRPSENPPGGCGELAAYLTDYLNALGFEVLKYPEPENDADITSTGLSNLIVRQKFGDGPVIALVAHGDTAVAGPGWKYDPFGSEIIDGKMYGRGVVAAKGTLCAYVSVLLALRDQAENLDGCVELHITFDGESGGDLGGRWLLANNLTSPDLVIAAGSTHSLISTSTGSLLLEVEIKGRSAPASLPEAGIDTLDAAARVMTAIYNLRPDYAKIRSDVEGIGSPTIIVSQLHAGDSPRSVAGRAVITIERTLIPEEDPAKVEGELTSLIGTSVVQVPGVLCKVRRRGLQAPMVPTDGADDLVEAFQRHAPEVLDGPLEILGTALDTDGRHYSGAGIPTVLYGVGPSDPGEANVGGPDECLSLDDLRRSTELLVFVLSDLLSRRSA
jgi:succinyl-diaminopimelate desuccinylase